MKDVFRCVFAAIVLLGLVGTLACEGDVGRGGADSSATSAGTDESGDQTSDAEAQDSGSTASFGEDFWDDIPVYAASTPIEKGTWSIPPQDDSEYSKVDWRYYELPQGNDPDMIARFYQMEMPKRGWQEMTHVDVEGTSMAFYTRNGGNEAAYMWANTENGKPVYALMRAAK